MAGVLYPVLQRRRTTSQASQLGVQTAAPPDWRHVLFSTLLVVLIAWALWESRSWGFRARLFPWAIGFPAFVMALLQFSMDLRGAINTYTSTRHVPIESETPLVVRRTIVISSWILGFFVVIWFLGFPIAVPLCILLYLKAGAGERWPISILLTLLASVAFYSLFVYTLHVPFPEGRLVEWLAG